MTSERRRLRQGPTVASRGHDDRPPLHFRYAEWADESETVPAHWQGRDTEPWPDWHHIRAYKRYSAAARAWRAERGVSFERWQAMRRVG